MKPTKLFLLLLLLPLAALSTGCYNDNEQDLYPSADTTGGGATCNTASVTYSGTVRAILTQNCATAGCHAASAPAAGYNLSDWAGTVATATSGRLLGSINHETGYSPMPKNGVKLPQCSIDQITAWVNAGAPNN